MDLGRELAGEKSPQGFTLLESGAPSQAPRASRRGSGLPLRHLGGDRGVDAGQYPGALRGRESVEQGETDEQRVAPAIGRSRRREPPGELPSAGGRHPVEEATGAAAGPEGPEEDPAVPPEAGERRVDLGDSRGPGRAELVLHRPREVISRPRLGVEEAEEDMGQGHRGTISI
jgi:hypothetical protein